MQQPHLGTFVTDELLTELNRLFPDRCARKGMSPEDIWMEAGTRKVIDCLKSAKAEVDANVFNH